MYDFDKSLGKITQLVSKALGHRLEQKLASRGFAVTAAQWSIISLLHKKYDLTQKDISSLLEIDKVMVTRIINQLEKANLVSRNTFSDDRRSNRINLTKSGNELYEKLVIDADSTLIAAFKNIQEEEINQVMLVLDRIYLNIRKDYESKK